MVIVRGIVFGADYVLCTCVNLRQAARDAGHDSDTEDDSDGDSDGKSDGDAGADGEDKGAAAVDPLQVCSLCYACEFACAVLVRYMPVGARCSYPVCQNGTLVTDWRVFVQGVDVGLSEAQLRRRQRRLELKVKAVKGGAGAAAGSAPGSAAEDSDGDGGHKSD
jgi:hypothetical protein